MVSATSIAAPLVDLAARSLVMQGRVLATFERSAYLNMDDRVIAVVWPGLGRGPFAISLSEPAPLASVPAGTAAWVEAGHLWIGPLGVTLAGATLWDPSLIESGTRLPSMHGAARIVIDILARFAPPESVAGLVAAGRSHEEGAHARLIGSLERGLAGVRTYLDGTGSASEAARVVASEIAGRGPGLTPSGDDVLVGIMHAVTVWPVLAGARAADEVRMLLRDSSAPRTTLISRAYLAAAAQGLAIEPWHAFVRSFGSGDDAVRATARALLRVGETSGADALTGFCWALSRLAA